MERPEDHDLRRRGVRRGKYPIKAPRQRCEAYMSLAAGREQWKPRHDDAAVIKKLH
jgi:hypothetical protein